MLSTTALRPQPLPHRRPQAQLPTGPPRQLRAARLPAAMKRGASAQEGKSEGGGMLAEPPAGPSAFKDAAALAAEPPDRPVPIPEAPTHRGALEQATGWVPEPLQPAAMFVVSLPAGSLLRMRHRSAALESGRLPATSSCCPPSGSAAIQLTTLPCLPATSLPPGGPGPRRVDGGGPPGAHRLAPGGVEQPAAHLGRFEICQVVRWGGGSRRRTQRQRARPARPLAPSCSP